MLKYRVNVDELKRRLEDTGFSRRQLGDKNDPNYCGVSDRTLRRIFAERCATGNVIQSLNKIIYMDDIVGGVVKLNGKDIDQMSFDFFEME